MWASHNTLVMGLGKVSKPFAEVLTGGSILIIGSYQLNEATDKLTQHKSKMSKLISLSIPLS